MADEDTTQVEDAETSNDIVFSPDEISSLEADFKEAEEAEAEGESRGPDEEDADLESEEEEEEDEDEDDPYALDDEDEEETEESDKGDEEGTAAAAKERQEDEDEDEEADKGFLLVVDGKEIEVDNVDQLAALAQKGIFYEKRATESKRALESAQWTMQAMINDHFGFLEEFYTQKFGDYESARQHVAKLAHKYVVPYYKEMQAEPDRQLEMREKRQMQRQLRNQPQNGGKEKSTYSQEDIEQLQTLEHNVDVALREVGLPNDSEPLRKRMADIMLDALGRDDYMHPLNAAKALLKERKALQKELARTAPKKGRKGAKSKKQKKADIVAAKAKRSRKKPGTPKSGGRRREATPSFTGREFLNSINKALDLEP